MQPRRQRGCRFRCGEVDLGDDDAIGQRRLLHRFRLPVEMHRTVHGIDGGEHAAETEMVADLRFVQDGAEDRRRIGQPRGLHHQPRERHLAALAPRVEAADRLRQVAADGAADAARLHQQHVAAHVGDQVVIEADLPELVDQHGAVGEVRTAQHMPQQRGLAGAEEAGEHMHRDAPVHRAPRAAMRAIRPGSSGSIGRPSMRPAASQTCGN